MEIFVLLFIIAIIYAIVKVIKNLSTPKRTVSAQNAQPLRTAVSYTYGKKQSILTKTERIFYANLQEAVNDYYVIVPQAHLSSFLSHTEHGQNWKAAFARINGKSVDFLLCSKVTLEPICAIELDDYTHNTKVRKERDSFVDATLSHAGIPLARFTQGQWEAPSQIRSRLTSLILQR